MPAILSGIAHDLAAEGHCEATDVPPLLVQSCPAQGPEALPSVHNQDRKLVHRGRPGIDGMHERDMPYSSSLCSDQSAEQDKVGNDEIHLLAPQFVRNIQRP